MAVSAHIRLLNVCTKDAGGYREVWPFLPVYPYPFTRIGIREAASLFKDLAALRSLGVAGGDNGEVVSIN